MAAAMPQAAAGPTKPAAARRRDDDDDDDDEEAALPAALTFTARLRRGRGELSDAESDD